jgi:predicted Co/Zn/Cd cation transporter (cation efflux family)
VQGELFVVFEFWIGLCSLLEHGFGFGCVEPLLLSKGSETCLLLVMLLFAFPLALDHLLEFILVVCFLFLFFFSLVTNHVCCQCTHRGGD